MSNCTTVKICFGPYESNGFIKHKQQRLYGLIKALNALEYEVELEPVTHLNRATFHVCDRLIFSCDIRFLPFNCATLDPLSDRIIDTIRKHTKRFGAEKNVPKFASVKRGARWMQMKGREYGSFFAEGLKTPRNTLKSTSTLISKIPSDSSSADVEPIFHRANSGFEWYSSSFTSREVVQATCQCIDSSIDSSSSEPEVESAAILPLHHNSYASLSDVDNYFWGIEESQYEFFE